MLIRELHLERGEEFTQCIDIAARHHYDNSDDCLTARRPYVKSREEEEEGVSEKCTHRGIGDNHIRQSIESHPANVTKSHAEQIKEFRFHSAIVVVGVRVGEIETFETFSFC